MLITINYINQKIIPKTLMLIVFKLHHLLTNVNFKKNFQKLEFFNGDTQHTVFLPPLLSCFQHISFGKNPMNKRLSFSFRFKIL